MSWTIHTGDCIEEMAKLEEASVDAVVCDPPYGISFMGSAWDGAAIEAAMLERAAQAQPLHKDGTERENPRMSRAEAAGKYDLSLTANRRYQAWCELWARECLRALKPGGHLLASCGSRTYQRMACGIEDAGFEIRDTILWLYGSGFPKSLDVSKAIDKAAGAEREVVGPPTRHGDGTNSVYAQDEWTRENQATMGAQTAPATPQAAEWEGWGTALKPAHEPIVVARKPPVGTVSANVLEHGTGAINVDACRLDSISDGPGSTPASAKASGRTLEGGEIERQPYDGSAGRWPANLVLSHTEDCVAVGTKEVKPANGSGTETVTEWECAEGCPVAELDRQSGRLQSGRRAAGVRKGMGYHGAEGDGGPAIEGDAGGASRFFYCAKTSRAERNAGLEDFEEKQIRRLSGGEFDHNSAIGADGERYETGSSKAGGPSRNHHPTVKPINLMRWLCRLVTPPGGLIVDPFLGSGSTGCAAVLEGFDFVGIEREPEYVAIAEARLAFWAQHIGREVEDVLGRVAASRRAQRRLEGQPLLPGLEMTTDAA